MAKKQPKSSGLDIEDMMNDIDNQDELKKESEDLSNQLQEIHSAITQQKYLLKDMQFMTESLEQISKKLDRGAEINKEILGDIQTTISNTHNVQFTATLDDDSVSAINNAYNSFLNNQEKALNEMERDLRTHMSTFHYDLCKALSVLKRHLSGWQAFSLLQSALSLQRLHCGSLLLLENNGDGIIETEKGQMSLRDVDYQLQTVKIDLIYTLLYINKRFISYFCKCNLWLAAESRSSFLTNINAFATVLSTLEPEKFL